MVYHNILRGSYTSLYILKFRTSNNMGEMLLVLHVIFELHSSTYIVALSYNSSRILYLHTITRIF